jgi:hypothetical protein
MNQIPGKRLRYFSQRKSKKNFNVTTPKWPRPNRVARGSFDAGSRGLMNRGNEN